MTKKLYIAPEVELIEIATAGVILTSLDTNAPASTGPANIESEDIHGNGSLW